jgi:hypothetical protein
VETAHPAKITNVATKGRRMTDAEPYTPIPKSIITSTIWLEKPHIFKVWMTMILSSDAKGIVRGSVPGLANLAHVTTEECREALSRFRDPDPDSRTKDYEGRRIEDIDGGWRLFNHKRQRDMMGIGHATSTERVRAWRERRAGNETDETPDETDETFRNNATPGNAQQEQEQDQKQDRDQKRRSRDSSGRSDTNPSGYRRTKADVPCSPDLHLSNDQRSILEMNLGMAPWQIDALQADFVTKAIADPSDVRPPEAWAKCLAKTVTSEWNRGNRPVQPTPAKPKDNDDCPAF